MKGAGEYYYPITCCYKELGMEKIKDGYSINNIYFRFGFHARGREMFIDIIKNKKDLIDNGIYKCDSLRVYDAVSGQRGWTEVYGFVLQGKWVSICEEIMKKSIILYEERKAKVEENKRMNEELENKKLLNKAKEFEKFVV